MMTSGREMMSEKDKFVRIVAHLNQLTQENTLKWSSVSNPDDLDLGRDKSVGAVFETTYKNKKLRVYEEQYKYWTDEDSFSWSTRIVLAFVGSSDNNSWEFPNIAGLYDLLESVRYQSADVDNFINDIFSGNE